MVLLTDYVSRKLQLLRRFDFAIVNPMRPLKTVNFGLSLHSEFWLTATRREPLL